VTVVTAVEVQTSATDIVRERLAALHAAAVEGAVIETTRGEVPGSVDSAHRSAESETG